MNQVERNWLQKLFVRIAATRWGAWLSARIMHRLDRWVLRWSNGRFTAAALLTGLPIITLTTTGAKSGRKHRLPLVGILDGDRLILIASNWGQKRHPAWYYNLRAHPKATVTMNGRSQTYRARETTGAERVACWQKAVQLYPGYQVYTQRTGGRQIPVMRLDPLP